MDPMGDLKDIIVGGLVEDIRQVEESVALNREIRVGAKDINGAALGPLFSRLQIIMGRHAITSTIHLFDPPEDNYPSRSIPVALNHMRFTADYLKIENRDFVIKKLIGFRHEESQFEGIPEPWINQLVRKEFADRLPDAGQPDSNELSKALDSLKSVRDRIISHSEEVIETDEWQSSEKDITLLMEYARDFVATISKGYLNIDYVLSDGDTIFRIDADRTTEMLKRLLKKAGVQN